MENTLSIYGSHDASVVFLNKSNKITILEYERFVKKRYAMYSESFDKREKDLGTNQKLRENFIQYIKSQTKGEIKNIVYNSLNDKDIKYLQSQFPHAEFKLQGHHLSHAASGYFPSKYNEAVIFSVDGGGLDNGMVAYTKIFKAKDNNIDLIDTPNINLGVAYGKIGGPISEIKPGLDSNTDSLVYAGKVMGLCAYGNVRDEWVKAMNQFYHHHNINQLGNDIGLNLNFNSLNEQMSYDLAATSQYVFEELLFNIIAPYIENNTNFIIVGGCALNVLFNQRFKKLLTPLNKNLYIPSNPNDCGLALGQFLLEHPKVKTNVYNGFEILDYNFFESLKKDRNAQKITILEIVNLLKQGKIIGLVEGGSEIGPRALGNRSIICDPSVPDMKNILNRKVKFREWFRPFAPVCRLEDMDIYFDDVYESEFMSYAPYLKDEFHTKLKAICHIDGTARLQTVRQNQHHTFYSILTELKNKNELPIILNTSFNIKGQPILNTIQDALFCLDNTEMDYVIIEGYLFRKK